MFFSPAPDDDTLLIQKRLELLGISSESTLVRDELIGMGKHIISHLLNAWENPPTSELRRFNLEHFYQELDKTLRTLIARDDLSLEQLRRYRMLITSEKVDE